MGTNFDDRLAVHATIISNDFLDKYMAQANGDYIKVYLFLLRHRGEKISISDTAEALNLTEGDIERAVRYWEKQGVFANGSGAGEMPEKTAAQHTEAASDAETGLTGQAERTGRAQETRIPARKAAPEEVKVPDAEAVPEARMQGTLDDVKDDEDFAGIMFVAKHVLPALPTRKQVETIEFMYRELHMSAELIEFLLEYCASIGKTRYQYMQKIAIDWNAQGITEVGQAQVMVREFSKADDRKGSGKQAAGRTRRSAQKQNRFHNFDESDADYEGLVNIRFLEKLKDGADKCGI